MDYKSIAGSTIIDFTISNMPAHIELCPYINKQKIIEYTKPTGGSFGLTIVTDNFGMASGTIVFPSDPTLNLPTGIAEIQFGDSFTSFDSSVNFATTQYYSGSGTFSVSNTRTESLLPSASLTNTDANRTNTTQWMRQKVINEPLAQVFWVNPLKFPDGVFVQSVLLWFPTKDLFKPISLELRNVVNGVPSATSVISDSLVVKLPSEVNECSPYLLDETDYTEFVFKKLIYLLPDQEYAFCLLSEGSNYNLLSGTVNDLRIPYKGSWEYIFSEFENKLTERVTKNPDVRRLFHAGDYKNPDLKKNLVHVVKAAHFGIGTASFTIVSKDTSKTDYYNKYKFNPADKTFPKTKIEYSIKTKSNGTFPASFESLPTKQLVVLDSNRTANAIGDVQINVTFTNQSRYVSPVLDLEGTDFVVLNDNPLPTSAAIELPASSTYVSKVYKVEEGLDFTGISVELSANKPAGTSLKVYCKLLGAGDLDIENNQWIELPRKADKASEVTDLLSYVKDTYQTLQGLTYTDNSVTYTKFKEFKIRVDFVSTNSAVTPSINKMIIKTV